MTVLELPRRAEFSVPWTARAACRGATVSMFPSYGEPWARAQRICAGCDVRMQCLALALHHESGAGTTAGVWGTTTPRRRQRIYRRLRGLSKMDTTDLLEQLRHLAEHPPDDVLRLRDELTALVFAVDALTFPQLEPAQR